MKKSYGNNRFKMSAPTWSNKFWLPDVSYSISDVQDNFENVMKKTWNTDPPIRIYVKKNENRIKFKIKSRYYLELLTPKTMEITQKHWK